MLLSTSSSQCSSSVLGLAMHTYAPRDAATAQLSVEHQSSIDINGTTVLSSAHPNNCSIGTTTTPPSDTRYYTVMATLGVAANSGTYSGRSSVLINVENSSNVIINSTVTANEDGGVSDQQDKERSLTHLSSFSSTRGSSASSVLGLAAGAYSSHSPCSAAVQVSGGSAVVLAVFVKPVGTKNPQISFITENTGKHVATTTMGITVNSRSHHVASHAEFIVGHQSKVVIASRIFNTETTGGNTTVVSRTVNTETAASVLGIAVNSYSHSAVPTAAFSLSATANVTIATSSVLVNPNNAATSENTSLTLKCAALSANAAATTSGVAVVTSQGAVNQIAMNTLEGSLSVWAIVVGAVLQANVASSLRTASSAAGIAMMGDITTTTNVPSSLIDMWIGVAQDAKLAATGDSIVSAAVGLCSSTKITGFNSNNTGFQLCSDDTVAAPTAVNGAAVSVRPKVSNLHFNATVGSWWAPNDSLTAGVASAEESTDCRRKRHDVDAFITTIVGFHLYAPPTASPTLEQSSTSSSLLPSETQSTSTTHSAALSSPTASTTPTLTLPEPSADSTPTPPSPTRKTVAITNVLVLGDETATTVVLSTAGASGAIASTLGSGGGGVMVVAGSSVQLMQCGLAGADDKPGMFELPVQFALGEGRFSFFVGAVLAHTILQCVFLSVPLLVWHSRRTNPSKNSKSSLPRYLGMIFCGTHVFFTPGVLGGASTILNNDGHTLSLVIAGISASVVVLIEMVVGAAVHLGPRHGIVALAMPALSGRQTKLKFKANSDESSTTSRTTSSTSSGSSSTSSSDSGRSETDDELSSGTTLTSASINVMFPFLFSGGSTKAILVTLFDGCRHYRKPLHRNYSTLETVVFSIIAIISGARPQKHCNYAAFSIGALACLHLGYILLVRPYRTRLDTAFSTTNSVLLVMLSLCVAVVVQRNQEGHEAPQWALDAVQVCMWLVSIIGFVQLAVQGYWAYYVSQRRHHLEELRRAEEEDQEGDNTKATVGDLSKPLLTVAHNSGQQHVADTAEEEEMLTVQARGTVANNPLEGCHQ